MLLLLLLLLRSGKGLICHCRASCSEPSLHDFIDLAIHEYW